MAVKLHSVERKLAAILNADVEGYSRLMSDDEAATVHTVTAYRDLTEALIPQHGGRLVDFTGDNLLAEFASVVDAVQCAREIQEAIRTRNADLPEHRRMQFRIGINLGDVIVEGEHIYGDGVNVAARVQTLADGGGICLSGAAYDQVKNKLPLAYESLGEHAVKNIAEPVRMYRVRMQPKVAVALGSQRKPRGGRSWRRGALIAAALLALLGGWMSIWQLTYRLTYRSVPPLAEKPSIVVLPFVNMSGESGQEYFSDGMTEDVITDLARLPGMLVIARNTAFSYKGKSVRPQQVRQELGVRYTLEGSVRKANNRVRISAQLVDATTGYHVWAENYDRDLQDIFAVQEEIAQKVTKALAVRLAAEEQQYMRRPYTSSEPAWEHFMQGAELYRHFTPKDNAQARELFEKATTLDPEFARAYANLAATHRQDASMEWTPDRGTSQVLAYRMAQKAVELARREPEPKPSLPYALEQWGYVLLYSGQHQEANAAAEEAVLHSSSYADGYALGALVLIYSGRPEEALSKTKQAINLDPNPFFYDYHLGSANYVWGLQTQAQDRNSRRRRFEEAETHLRDALRKNGNFRPARAYLAAVLSELGRQDEAVNEMAILWKGRNFRAPQDLKRFQEYHQRNNPYKDPAITTHLVGIWTDLWKAAESRP